MTTHRDRFESLVAAERHSLLATARGILRDPEEAEDVLQETLLSVWHRVSESPPGHLRGYLYRSVELNALKHRTRRRRHLRIEAAGEIPCEDAGDGPADEIDPWTLECAVLGLPAPQQAVLRMKYYLGLTFREIGTALAISSNTAASRCRYALTGLRRHFERLQADSEGVP